MLSVSITFIGKVTTFKDFSSKSADWSFYYAAVKLYEKQIAMPNQRHAGIVAYIKNPWEETNEDCFWCKRQ